MTSHANQPSTSISATTTSARAAYPVQGTGVRVCNSGAVTIFVASGDSSIVATSASQPVLANSSVELKHNPTDTHLAAITASGTATVYFADAGIVL